MAYSTGDIESITIDDFIQKSCDNGTLLFDVMLDDGTRYLSKIKINVDDYKHVVMEDLNYELGHKKNMKLENMREYLLNANYSSEDIEEFVNHVNKDKFRAPF